MPTCDRNFCCVIMTGLPMNVFDDDEYSPSSATYKRLQGVVSQVSALVDSSSLLVTSGEPFIRGQTTNFSSMCVCIYVCPFDSNHTVQSRTIKLSQTIPHVKVI